MSKKSIKIVKDIVITFLVILVVRFILCFINGTEMFTDSFLLFLIVFVLSSIFFKVILKFYND